MGMRRLSLAALAAAALLGGCGGGSGSGTSDAVDLTKWLPTDATSYWVADVSRIKEDLGLPEDASPVEHVRDPTQDPAVKTIGIFLPPGADPERVGTTPLLQAIDPGAVTAAAAATLGTGADLPRVAVLQTTADTGEVGSALGDLGYTDDGGVLIPPHDSGGAPAVRLDDGLIFASTEPSALRAIPDDPAGQLPLEILGDVEGTGILAVPTGDLPAANGDCVAESATAGDREEGELAYMVEGGASADAFSAADAPQVDEVDVDGNLLVAHVRLGDGLRSVDDFVAAAMPRYDCG